MNDNLFTASSPSELFVALDAYYVANSARFHHPTMGEAAIVLAYREGQFEAHHEHYISIQALAMQGVPHDWAWGSKLNRDFERLDCWARRAIECPKIDEAEFAIPGPSPWTVYEE